MEHIKFGLGVITEVNDDKIVVQFQDKIGTKAFLYPEAFEKFLKAVNPTVENNVMEECHRKKEQIELEFERMEKEREAAELEEKKAKLELIKKKSTPKSSTKLLRALFHVKHVKSSCLKKKHLQLLLQVRIFSK